ncbi:MAG: hypothetical protein ACREBD_27695, partial [Blastocatellia bacterium]
MKHFYLKIARLAMICTLVSIPFTASLVEAQSPSFAMQNGASFINIDSATTVVARGGHAIIYPTGSNFVVTGSGQVSPPATEAFGARIKVSDGTRDWFASLTFVSSTQINLVLPYDPISGVNPTGVLAVTVQKTDGMGGWLNDRSRNVNIGNYQPHSFVDYQGGSTPYLNAELWGCVDTPCTGAEYIKKLLDGNPNPRTYNNNPTILVIYVTGARVDPSDIRVKLDGGSAQNLLGSGMTSFLGVEQANWQLPSGISSGSHTIQITSSTSGDTNTASIVLQ